MLLYAYIIIKMPIIFFVVYLNILFNYYNKKIKYIYKVDFKKNKF